MFAHRLLPFSFPLGLGLFDNFKVFFQLLGVGKLRFTLLPNLSNPRSESLNLLHGDVDLLIHGNQRSTRLFNLLLFVRDILLRFGHVSANFGMILFRILNILLILFDTTAILLQFVLVFLDLFTGRVNRALEMEKLP